MFQPAQSASPQLSIPNNSNDINVDNSEKSKGNNDDSRIWGDDYPDGEHLILDHPDKGQVIFWAHLKAAAVHGTEYSWEDLIAPNRAFPLVRIRQAIFFFLLTHPDFRGIPYKTVSTVLARDHTTAMHHEEIAWDKTWSARRDPDFWDAYDRLVKAQDEWR